MSTRLVSQLFSGLVAICAGALPAVAQPAGKDGAQIPDFSTHKLWVLMSGTMFLHAPGDPGPGPIVQEGKPFKVDQVPYRANTSNPILKPWAKKVMDVNNDRVRAGDIPFYTTSRCWPGGVPGQLLYPAEPAYFIQTPKEVWMVWQRDHMVRRIYLTDKHSTNPAPQPFGESIGHYEGNDTLVVDTISLTTKNNFIDNFRTPHSPKEHVTERFTISPDGKSLSAVVMVDDADTFNEPLHMMQTWHKVRNPLIETVCAENNNDAIFFHQKLFPLPEAKSADF